MTQNPVSLSASAAHLSQRLQSALEVQADRDPWSQERAQRCWKSHNPEWTVDRGDVGVATRTLQKGVS
jgi:hypothetical protein